MESAETTHERFEVTRNGARVAVLLGADDFDALVETVEILGSNETMDEIRQGLADLKAGNVHTVDDVRAAMAKSNRIAQ